MDPARTASRPGIMHQATTGDGTCCHCSRGNRVANWRLSGARMAHRLAGCDEGRRTAGGVRGEQHRAGHRKLAAPASCARTTQGCAGTPPRLARSPAGRTQGWSASLIGRPRVCPWASGTGERHARGWGRTLTSHAARGDWSGARGEAGAADCSQTRLRTTQLTARVAFTETLEYVDLPHTAVLSPQSSALRTYAGDLQRTVSPPRRRPRSAPFPDQQPRLANRHSQPRTGATTASKSLCELNDRPRHLDGCAHHPIATPAVAPSSPRMPASHPTAANASMTSNAATGCPHPAGCHRERDAGTAHRSGNLVQSCDRLPALTASISASPDPTDSTASIRSSRRRWPSCVAESNAHISPPADEMDTRLGLLYVPRIFHRTSRRRRLDYAQLR